MATTTGQDSHLVVERFSFQFRNPRLCRRKLPAKASDLSILSVDDALSSSLQLVNGAVVVARKNEFCLCDADHLSIPYP